MPKSATQRRAPSSARKVELIASYGQASFLETASKIRVVPNKGRGKGEIVPLDQKTVSKKTCPGRLLIMHSPLEQTSRHTRSTTSEIPTSGPVSSLA